MVERLGVQPDELPLMVCPNGTVLKRPTDAEAGMCLGITPELDPEQGVRRGRGRRRARRPRGRGLCRVRGPVGAGARSSARSAARPAPRRGSRTISAFRPASPAQALAGRAFSQALKFGAEVAIPLEVAHLDCGGPARRPHEPLRLELTDGQRVSARTVVVASGARYRRPDISESRELRRRGRLLLGVAGRGEAVRGRGGGAGRRRQLGGAGGGVSRAQGQAACISSCAARASRRRCRAI